MAAIAAALAEGSLSNSSGSLLAVTATTIIPKGGIKIFNTNAAAQTVLLYANRDGSSRLISRLSLDENQSYTNPEVIVLESGDILEGETTTATGVNYIISGAEDGSSASSFVLTVKEADGSPTVASVDTIVVSNGTLVDDGGGQVTLTTGGGMVDFTLAGTSGSNQLISDGDVLTIAAGTGISTTGGATDTVTIAITTVPLANGGTNANLSATGPGALIQASNGANVTVLKHNLAASAAPTSGDDTADGYAVGSLWIDTTGDKSYICVDATGGAAVWNDLTAGGVGMTSFTLAGTSGSNQTISDGNTLTIAAGTGISTTGGATDTVTVAISTVPLANGGTNANLSATGPGYLAQATNGANVSVVLNNWSASVAPTANEDSGDGYGVGSYWYDTTADKAYVCLDATLTAAVWKDITSTGTFSSFSLAGTSGSPQSITDGNTVTIAAGTGISTTAGATDTVTVAISTVPLANGGTNANLSATGPGALIQASNGANVTVLKHNLAASAAPTTAADSSAGYAVGSLWVDTTGDKSYICVDASVGAAVWNDLTASAAGMTSFTLAGTSGSSQTISDGNTLTIAAGTGISTTGGATDTVTVAISTVPLANGGTNANLSATGPGYLVQATNGANVSLKLNNWGTTVAPAVTDDSDDGYSVGSYWYDTTADKVYVCIDATVGAAVWKDITSSGTFSSFSLAGTSGSPQSITDGNTVTIAAGTGISTTAGATDTVTVAISTVPLANGGTNANLSATGPGALIQASNGANVTVLKHNLAASAAPTTAADSSAGYAVGSLWIDTTGDKSYICVDASVGAAVWNDLTASAAGMTSFTLAGTSGSNQTISDGNTLTIAAGTGISTTGGATDTVTVAISTVPLANGGTNANLSATGPGALIQASNGANVTVLKHNLAASAAPTSGDDTADGYAVGSLWIDTTGDKSYICVDATGGAAVWNDLTASATGMASFTLAGSSGANQTITDGNTLTIEAGTGITTTGAATDKVTVAISTVPLANGGTNANLSATGPGYLVQATNGANVSLKLNNWGTTVAPTANEDTADGYAVGSYWYDTTADKVYVCIDATAGAAVWKDITNTGTLSSFSLAGTSGTPQSITDGNTLTIAAGTGISTTAGATDTVTVAISTVPLANGGTNANLSATGPGALIQASNGANVTVLKHNLAASAAPTTAADSSAGYAVGSLWIDTTGDKSYLCVDASVGAAVWNDLTASAAGMTSFTLAGTSGSNQTISDGNTLTIAAGTGISTTGSATDTVTVAISTVPLANGGTNANLSATGPGYLVQATNGANVSLKLNNWGTTVAPTANDDSGDGYSVGSYWYDTTADKVYVCIDATLTAAVWKDITSTGTLSSFSLAGTSGTPQSITDGNTVTIAAGTGISTTAGATDTVTIAISTVPLANGGTNANLSATGPGALIQASNGANVTVLKHNLAASAAPTTAADSSAGYAVGSLWIDTTGDKSYLCVDASVGAAVWNDLTAGGTGMTSFTLAGTSGSNQTIENGNTLTIEAGTGITTTGAATDKVTVAISTVPLANGGTNANLSATNAGYLIQATGGANVSSMMNNWASASNPAVTDDSGDGYGVGSFWFNTTADHLYVCLDATVGAAVWRLLSGIAIEEVDGSPAVNAIKIKVNNANLSDSSGTVTIDTQGSYACICDQKSTNTAGGTFTQGAWQVRDLNTEITDADGIVSIASNQFTPIAGVYIIRAFAPANRVNQHIARLYNATAASSVLTGTSHAGTTGQTTVQHAMIFGLFTANGSDAYEINHYCASTYATTGFGVAANLGSASEKYTVVELWRISS